MKKAIMALDGGGSNLRIAIVDSTTEKVLFYKGIDTGTNLTTVPNREEALTNIKNLVKEGYDSIPEEYEIEAIGLSSAGTEIKENVDDLNRSLNEALQDLDKARDNFIRPQMYITNDVDILLHSSDIALVAGTGAVAAVKYNDKVTGEEVIDKFDGDGQVVGDSGSGYWIAREVLKRVGQIEKTGFYLNHKNKITRAPGKSILREMVLEKLLKEIGYSDDVIQKVKETSLKEQGLPDYISIVQDASRVDGKIYDRAKIAKMFGALADTAARKGDPTANEILEVASQELFINIVAAYERAGFNHCKPCNILLSGSVLTKGETVRKKLEEKIKEHYPYGVKIKVNDEEPVFSTVKYIKGKTARVREHVGSEYEL